MATQQDGGGVLFSIAHDLRQFRLLELPAELLELLDAPDPPKLSVKSQAPSAASGAPNAKPAYAVLCTPSKTFQLRQVQTSNSVLITQPALEAHNHDMPVPTARAIATCTSTLELHPAEGNPVEVLRELLPVYHIVDDEVHASGNGKGQDSMFRNMPFSDGQCETAWQELLAFQLGGSSWRPSASTLAQIWKSLNEAVVAEGIKLDKQFLTEDVLKAIDDEAYPVDLILSILSKLGTGQDGNRERWSCLDRTKTVTFVGTTLLDSRIGGSDFSTTDFLSTWKDCLPEVWRTDAELKAIEGTYTSPTSTTIRSKKGAEAAKADDSTSKGSSSRKWHERFGRARMK